jgi:hypothetical protein
MTVSGISPAVEQAAIDYLDRKPSRKRDRFLYGPVRIPAPGERAAERRAAILRYAQQHEGLPDDTIRDIQKRSAKMAKAAGQGAAALPPIYLAQVLKSLAELGLARLSAREIISLMPLTADIPADISIAIMTFIAKHPPMPGDRISIEQAIRTGAIGGIGLLLELHRKTNEQRQRTRSKTAKLAKALAQAQPPARPRPVLLSAWDRAEQRRLEQDREAAKRAMEHARTALARLYPARHQYRPWVVEFLECVAALRASGFEMTLDQSYTVLQIAGGTVT